MSDFSLKFDQLNGIITKLRDISDSLSSSQGHANTQASRLSGMSGFGILKIQAAISNLARDLARLSGDTNAIASFVDELQRLVIDHENKAVIALGGEVDAFSQQSAVAAMWASFFAALPPGMQEFFNGMVPCTVFSGDPVNMATGNFVYEAVDINIPGSFPLKFKRFYNSMDGSESPVGANWTHNYHIFLKKVDGSARVTFQDGRTEEFLCNDDGSFTSPIHQTSKLDKLDDGYVMTLSNMEQYTFDEAGKLIKTSDLNNNETVFEYNGSGLAKVSTQSGSLYFKYNKDGKITKLGDHTGRVVAYQYNEGLLISATQPTGAVYRYEYGANGKISKMINPRGITFLENEYDSEHRAVKQTFPDGGVSTLEYPADKPHTVLTEQNGNKITYVRDDGFRTTQVIYEDSDEKFEYNANNQRTMYTDRNGNVYIYTYDERGNQTRNTDPLGHTTTTEYSDLNKPVKITLPNSGMVLFEYDENGNAIKIVDPLQRELCQCHNANGLPTNITLPDGSHVHFTYDECNNVTKLVDGFGVTTMYRYNSFNRVVASIDGNGNETQYQYDAAGNLTEVKNAAGDACSYVYNKSGKVTDIADFDGGKMRIEYNSLNKPSKLTDKLGRETLLNYDLMWNVTQVTEPNGAETKFAYNTLNRLEYIEKPDGGKISYQYDANGNRTGLTDEAGNQTSLAYDTLNQLIEVKDAVGTILKYEYNANGQVTRVTNAMGHAVELSYDAAGQLIEEHNPMGDIRKYTYTPLGNVESITDESGIKTFYEYEPGGRLKNALYPDGTSETYSYDNAGNINAATNRLGQATAYFYDSLNRIVKITNSEGASKQYSYDAVSNVTGMTDENGHTTTYEYTLTGQLSKVTDALGNIAAYTYDERDQLIEIRQSCVEVAVGSAVSHTSDVLGLDVDLEKANAQNTENRALRLTKYHRNIMGQVKRVEDALGGIECYNYDVKGQLIEKIDKDGYLTKYGYTVSGDVNHIQYADGRNVKLSYNPLRQLTEVEDWLGITKIEVDALGRATKVVNHQDKIVSYAWGSSGERRGVTYPSGKHVAYEYDASLRLTQVDDGEIQTTYSYDEHSRLTEKVFSNGTKTQYQYSALGRLQELSHWDTDGLLDRYQYDYDPMGNKTGIMKQRKGLAEESGAYAYSYDPLNRLQDVSRDGKLLRSYEYDAYGNRSKVTLGENQTSYSYNALNQLISTADTAGEEQHYMYDKRGNLTELYKNGALVNQYQFGTLNRLESAFNFEKNIGAIYSYNGLGHRVGKTEGANIEPMLSTAGLGSMTLSPTKQIDDVLDLTRQYHNLLERDGTAYVWDSSMLFADKEVYLLDDLGSPVRFGQYAYGYDEFGNTLYGDAGQPFGFTGYQPDTASGTCFAQARQYNPNTGRFISKDQITGFTGLPQSFNQYAYCWNQPLDFVDLDGLFLRRIGEGLGNIGNTIVDTGRNIVNTVVDAGRAVGNFIYEHREVIVTGLVVVGSAALIVATGGLAVVPLAATKVTLTGFAVATAAGYGIGAGLELGSQVFFGDGTISENWQQVDWRRVNIAGQSVALATGLTAAGVPAPLAFGFGGGLRDIGMQIHENGGAENINWHSVIRSTALAGAFTYAGGQIFGNASLTVQSFQGGIAGFLAGKGIPATFRGIGSFSHNLINDLLNGNEVECEGQ